MDEPSPVASLPAGTCPESFVSHCDYDQRAALSAHSPLGIYGCKTGGHVVAWWYYQCGMPAGVVALGDEYPED